MAQENSPATVVGVDLPTKNGSWHADYHLHTAFSHDCATPLSAQCERAVAAGLREVAPTDHVEWFYADDDPNDPAPGYFRPAEYVDAIRCCRERFGSQITIRAGIEVGSPHLCASRLTALQAQCDFDFIIGSLHIVNGRAVTRPGYVQAHTEHELYAAYFEELTHLARDGDYDVIGHLDVCKRHGAMPFGPFAADRYAEAIRETLRAVIARGRGIEINCSGLRHACQETYPALQVLRWYREMGGEILTIGTDAHSSDQVGVGLEDGVLLAQAAGFRALTGFEGRTPYWVDLP